MQKQKVAKSFAWFRTSCGILWILRYAQNDEIEAWILRNCGIAGGLESVKEEGLYFLQKQKVAKAFGF